MNGAFVHVHSSARRFRGGPAARKTACPSPGEPLCEPTTERWPSGRRHAPAKGAYLKRVSWVRIPSSPPLFLEISLFINALAECVLQCSHNLSHIGRSLAQGFRPFQLPTRPRLGVLAPSRDRSRGQATTDSGLKERGFLAEGRRIRTQETHYRGNPPPLRPIFLMRCQWHRERPIDGSKGVGAGWLQIAFGQQWASAAKRSEFV